MPAPETVSEQLAPVMAWLASEPADDPHAELSALRVHVGRLPEPVAGGASLAQCIDELEMRVLDVCGRLKPRLLTAALPLSHELHAVAGELVEALLELADKLREVAEATRERWRPARRADPLVLSARALGLVREAFVVAAMGGSVTPPGLWLAAYGAVEAGGGFDALMAARPDTPASDALHSLKRLLALSVLQPESLTARELAWANDFLEGIADEAILSREALQPAASSFWIDPSEDVPPIATIRSAPPATAGLVHFSGYGASRALVGQLDWLKERIAEAEAVGLERDGELLEPDASGLPVGLTSVEAVSLLKRMRDRWALPPNRGQARRAYQYAVQVCVGLRAIWEVARSDEASARISEWMVYNESPGGYALMSVEGAAGSLSAGMAVALRRDAGHPWSICIVRWIRSDSPGQVELGLQLVAQTCTPVTIGFRGGEERSATHALILPPLPALRRNQAILAPAGTYASRRFVLVHEGEHLYVAQARVVSLDMQTANVELFQYEIDPYPI
ncbi:hypothetical protein GPA22_08015 [Aromatoleum toluvorans]|uniref:Uncharacterized protein n=1 Tax=Aromatoleum toluvorans TaxID=92002 RepID=A0ABX1PWW3_9RHOO|nr:hypothetical protein [Aromatoleum toluvorans]NMG43675.1 hypothetical protein [Aromatoleum toluvorans]